MKIALILLATFIIFCVVGYLAACSGRGEFYNFFDWLFLRDKTKNENDKNTSD